MYSASQTPSAAGEHFADAERLLAALPLVKRRAERDRHVEVALVRAALAVAAGVPGQTVADRENDEKLPANGALPG